MKIIPPLFVVALLASPASAQGDPTIWPVSTAEGKCSISQSFADPDFGKHALVIGYDASRQEVSLTSTHSAPKPLPASGDLRWKIVFLDNGDQKHDDEWGPRRFDYVRDGDAYRFTTRFAGEKNVRQILADLAASRAVGIMDRDEVITAFDLGGIDRSLQRLCACAARTVATN